MSEKGQTNQPCSSVRRHNNDKLCVLLGKHLDACSECDPTWNGSYCKTGMHLRMMLGRTDCSARYDKAGFRAADHVDVYPYKDSSSSNARPPLWRKRPQSTQERGKLTAKSFGNQKHNL